MISFFTLLIFIFNVDAFTIGECGIDCKWHFNVTNNKLTISGKGRIDDFEMFETPWETYINNITEVEIGESIISIGSHAFFSSTSLVSVKLPDSIVKIGKKAFQGCLNLKTIVIPSNVLIIDDFAFGFCTSLEFVHIKSQNIYFGTTTFRNCNSLDTFYYEGIEEPKYNNTNLCVEDFIIEQIECVKFSCSPFSGNTQQLKAVLVPVGYESESFCGKPIVREENDEKILKRKCGPFSYWSVDEKNTTLTIHGYGPMDDYLDDRPWEDYRNKIQTIIITDGITKIGIKAFIGFMNLDKVVIGNSVKSIGNYAFSYCVGLESIEIPKSVSAIEGYAFASSMYLRNVTIFNNHIKFGPGVFWFCPLLKTFSYYGINQPSHFNEKTCYYRFMSWGCGSKEEGVSCSPFECETENLKTVRVCTDYIFGTFLGKPVSKEINCSNEKH